MSFLSHVYGITRAMAVDPGWVTMELSETYLDSQPIRALLEKPSIICTRLAESVSRKTSVTLPFTAQVINQGS